MEPLDLHYSRAKLIKLAVYSLLGTAMFLWVATGGISDEEASTGRGAWIGRMLGAEGLQLLGWVFALVSFVLMVLYLRRAFADPVAARADAQGVTIYTLLGSRFFAVRDIDRIELRHPMGQTILQVVPGAGQGKMRGLAANGLVEDDEDIEAWVHAAQQAWRTADPR